MTAPNPRDGLADDGVERLDLDAYMALVKSEAALVAEVERLRAEVERLQVNTYYDGCRDTLYRFAVHRNGGMVVGCGMTTYKEASAAIDAAEATGRSYSLVE